MKTTIEGINSRIIDTEEKTSELEDRMIEITAVEQNKEKIMKRNEVTDNLKCTNINIIGVPEGGEREKGPENICEGIIAKNLPNMRKKTLTQSRKHRESHARKTQGETH